MADHFTLGELLHTNSGKENSTRDNEEVLRSLFSLMDECLDPIRKAWGKPITVSSGYRSPAVNKAVGGKATSQHLKGEAADITTGTIEGNKELFNLIVGGEYTFDQLIDESGYQWLHISYRRDGKNRMAVLHLK